MLVVIEVKTRRDAREEPFDAITPQKAARLIRLANGYTSSRPEHLSRDIRIDAIAVTLGARIEVMHIKDAVEG